MYDERELSIETDSQDETRKIFENFHKIAETSFFFLFAPFSPLSSHFNDKHNSKSKFSVMRVILIFSFHFKIFILVAFRFIRL